MKKILRPRYFANSHVNQCDQMFGPKRRPIFCKSDQIEPCMLNFWAAQVALKVAKFRPKFAQRIAELWPKSRSQSSPIDCKSDHTYAYLFPKARSAFSAKYLKK